MIIACPAFYMILIMAENAIVHTYITRFLVRPRIIIAIEYTMYAIVLLMFRIHIMKSYHFQKKCQ